MLMTVKKTQDSGLIEFPYGPKQRFRRHHNDINVVGRFFGPLPAGDAFWSLNGSPEQDFLVEPPVDTPIDYSFQYKVASPSRLRLPFPGDFNLEIPADTEFLVNGLNALKVSIVDSNSTKHLVLVEFDWDPNLPTSSLDLDDLSRYSSVQDFGQVVNGRWDFDPILNVIRGRAPVYPDSLLLLGRRQHSQEATYQFRYFDGTRSKYVGFSDFFIGHEPEKPGALIKAGWSTAGLATSRPRGEGAWETRIWIARGDRPGWRPKSANEAGDTSPFGVVRTDPAVFCELQPHVWHNVRHRLEVNSDSVVTSIKVWQEFSEEPEEWLCRETHKTIGLESGATFGLFQHSGVPSEWRRISVREIVG